MIQKFRFNINFKVMKKLLLLILLFPTFIFAQTTKQDSIWLPMKYFVGEWTGKGGGEPGKGEYERSYKWIFNGKYIEIRNKSTYPHSANKPKGEVHEDVGYISYDRIRKKFVLRQFHIEGFVNQYNLDSISPDRKTIVFITESIENIPAGWKAREVYHLISDDEFEETFELAEPNKDFETYTKTKLIRKKSQ